MVEPAPGVGEKLVLEQNGLVAGSLRSPRSTSSPSAPRLLRQVWYKLPRSVVEQPGEGRNDAERLPQRTAEAAVCILHLHRLQLRRGQASRDRGESSRRSAGRGRGSG